MHRGRFHQLVNEKPVGVSLPGSWTPFDPVIKRMGGRKLGLDALGLYLSRTWKHSPETRPWLPDDLPPGAFLFDFHVHTSLSDGEGTFKSILKRLGRAGILDGIAFTNHPFSLAGDGKSRIPNEDVVSDSYKALDVAVELKKQGKLPESFLVVAGNAEFAPSGTVDFPGKGVELLGIGLPRTFMKDHGGLRRVRKMLAEELVDCIHDDGGLAILPHPFYFTCSGMSSELWDKVDAIEAFNHTCHVWIEPSMRPFLDRGQQRVPLAKQLLSLQPVFGYFSWRARLEVQRHPRPVVGSSDGHIVPFIGAGCTWFDERPADFEDLCALVRNAKGKPILNPRWEEHVDRDEVLDAAWNHWGKGIANALISIEAGRRWAIPPLRLVASILGVFSRRLGKNLENARGGGQGLEGSVSSAGGQ